MNLTQRFSLTHGFIALLAVTVTVGLMIGGANHFFWNEIHEAQRSQMENFSLAVQESHFANEDVATLDFIRQAVKDPMVAFAAFRDKGGHIRVLPASFQGTDMNQGDRILPGGRRLGVLSTNVQAGGQAIGTVVMAYDTAKLEARVRSEVQRWVSLASLAGTSALLVALLLSAFLSKALVSPLKRIKAGTELVRAGKLDNLVDVDRSDEIGSLARAFNAMVVQLRELEGMKRDFVAGVTHDFGVPLHAMKNALELLAEGQAGPLTPRQSEYLLMVSNNLDHLQAFIHNLLTTASIEAAKVTPFYEPLDALALAREIVELYRLEARKKGISLELLNEEASLVIVTDVTLFRQILTNLVSNALKYTLKGRVSIGLKKEKGFSTLQVADTGIGIDAKYQDLVFDKFFRVRQTKDFPVQSGSGLGLSIAKGLAETMGGSILLESRPGQGSVFTVNLVQRQPVLSGEPPAESLLAEAGGNGNGRKNADEARNPFRKKKHLLEEVRASLRGARQD